MAYDGSLIFDTKVDTKGFQKGSNTLKGQADGLAGSFKKLGKVIAGAFIVKKAFDIGKQAVGLASDIQEVQNVVDTAFGEMSYKMEEFAKTSIETFGISKLTAKQTGSTFMAMSVGMGIAQDSASDMAIALTGLSADMSSFYNKSQDITSTALKSIFTGETETLKQFGIVMTEANLEAYALSKGITKSYQTMSQAEKVQLRYNFVMNQTKLAQGDFAKTSDSWANQTRMLTEKWKEFLSIIGTGLIKVLSPVVKALNTVMTQLINFAQSASTLLSGLFGEDKAKNQQKTTKAIEGSVSATNDLAVAQEDVNKAVKKGVAGFDELNSLDNSSDSGSSASSLGGSIASPSIKVDVDTAQAEKNMSGLEKKCQDFAKFIKNRFGDDVQKAFNNLKKPVGGLKDTFSKVFSDISKLATPLAKWFKTGFCDQISAAISFFSNQISIQIGVFNKIFGTLWSIVSPILNLFVTEGLPRLSQFAVGFYQISEAIQNVVKSLVDAVWPTIQSLADFVTSVITDMMKIVMGVWDKYGKPLIEGVKKAIEGIQNILLALWNSFLKPIVDNIISACKRIWDEGLKGLVQQVMEFVAKVSQMILTIWNNFLAPVVKWIVEKFGPPISAIINALIKVFGGLLTAIGNILSGMFKALGGVIDFITGVFSGDWKKAWGGIKDIFKGIWDAIWGIIKGVVNLIIGGLNFLWSGLYKALQAIVNGVGGLIKKLGKVMGQDNWGFSIPKNAPQIPKLATGTVVPANYGEFMAVLGDNKKETEVVSPLSTMKQAFKEALAENGGNNNGRPIVIVLKVGAKEFARICIDSMNELTRLTGQLDLDLV